MSTNSQSNTIERAVSDAQDNVQFQKIVENAARVRRVTNKLCEQLSQLEDILKDIVEKYNLTDDLQTFDFAGFGLRYCGSRLAQFIHIVETDRCLLLPWTAAEVGKGFYYHDDFHAWYDYMDRQLVIDFAKGLREFLENFNEKLVQLAKETEIEIPKISIS